MASNAKHDILMKYRLHESRNGPNIRLPAAETGSRRRGRNSESGTVEAVFTVRDGNLAVRRTVVEFDREVR